MFKKLRKWYFKLYHLFRFLGIIILIFGLSKNVYAEECNNLLDIDNAIWYEKYESSWKVYYSLDGVNPEIITYKPNTNYTLFILNETDNSIDSYLCNDYSICNSTIFFGGTTINLKQNPAIFNYIGNESSFYFSWLGNWNNADKLKNALNNKEIKLYMVEGNEICIPEEEEPEENSVYSNFLMLYIDRIEYLANGFTENPYLLAMIGIIFTWVALELFLRILHLRGGYNK